MLRPARTLTVSIAAPADAVYGFVSDPRNLPLWAAGLGDKPTPLADGAWRVESPGGPMRVQFAPTNALGVADHVVTPLNGNGPRVDVPLRVIANGAGSEVQFTLFQQPGMSNEQYAADAVLVQQDLLRLKQVIEEPTRTGASRPATQQPEGAWTRTTRVIAAEPREVYNAFMDPHALVEWLPPGTMTGLIHAMDPVVGGGYEMSLFYSPDDPTARGKTAEREDRVAVRFVELVPGQRIVEMVRFETSDPMLMGEMRQTVTFTAVDAGTEVVILFENLPPGLRPEDNELGAQMSLDQLARQFE